MQKAYCNKSAETTVIKYSIVGQRCFIFRMISSDWKRPEKLPLTMYTYLLCVPQLLLMSHCYLYHLRTVWEWKINKNLTPKVMSSDQLDWKDLKGWIVTAKFFVLCCVVCKLQSNFGFSCPVNHLSGLLRKQVYLNKFKRSWLWFVIGGFWSVRFVSVFQGSLLVIILFRAIID